MVVAHRRAASSRRRVRDEPVGLVLAGEPGQERQGDRASRCRGTARPPGQGGLQVGAELVGHRHPGMDEVLAGSHRHPQRDGRPRCRGSAVAAGGGRCAAHRRARRRRTRSSLLPADPYRPRRFFSWFGAITTTARPASSRASTTGPSGRSIATSHTPALCSTGDQPAQSRRGVSDCEPLHAGYRWDRRRRRRVRSLAQSIPAVGCGPTPTPSAGFNVLVDHETLIVLLRCCLSRWAPPTVRDTTAGRSLIGALMAHSPVASRGGNREERGGRADSPHRQELHPNDPQRAHHPL